MSTDTAPAARRATAIALAVLPVVITSSIAAARVPQTAGVQRNAAARFAWR